MSLHPSNTIIVYILIFVNDYFSIFTMKECISHAKHGRFPHRNNISIIYVYICFSTPFACLFEYISYSTKNMQNITRGKCVQVYAENLHSRVRFCFHKVHFSCYSLPYCDFNILCAVGQELISNSVDK